MKKIPSLIIRIFRSNTGVLTDKFSNSQADGIAYNSLRVMYDEGTGFVEQQDYLKVVKCYQKSL